MTIDSNTKICGLIGYPIGHSVSPAIHNTLAEALGQNLLYVPLQVEPGKLEDAIKGALAFGFHGMNVTIPYKKDVIPFCSEVDKNAGLIGAVNTLVRCEGGYKGYNTDAPGLYRALMEDGLDPAGRKVVLLGAGGVARAMAFTMLDKGAASLHILNRTFENAQKLAQDVNQAAGREFAVPLLLSDWQKLEGEGYLALQATNIGMHPRVDAVVLEEDAFYRKVYAGFDGIYNPAETLFMKKVCANGGFAVNGLKMLLYQGIIAYELWNDVTVPGELADKIYEKLCGILCCEKTE